MLHDPSCVTPWGDEMPSKVGDYLCARSLDPFDYASKRTCHVNIVLGKFNKTNFRVILEPDYTKLMRMESLL